MADQTVTIKSSGGDYDGIQAWNDAAYDLQAAGDTMTATVGEAYQDLFDTGLNEVWLSGWNPGSGNECVYQVPLAYRAIGGPDDTKYRINYDEGGGIMDRGRILIGQPYTTVIGMQIINTRTTSAMGGTFYTYDTSLNVDQSSYDSCVSKHTYTGGSWATIGFISSHGYGDFFFRNCVGITYGTNSLSNSFVNSTGYHASGTNTTFENCTASASGRYGITNWTGKSPVHVWNCYAYGGVNAYRQDSSFASFGYCCSSDGTAAGTYHGHGLVLYTTANFANVTAGSEDLRLVEGYDTDLDDGLYNSDIPLDQQGTTRSDPPQVGAYEYLAAGGSVPLMMYHHLRHMGA